MIEAFHVRSIPLAIRAALTVRFEGADDFGGGLVEMERLPFIRFVFIILPAAVKLFSLQALPWTHRWGFCYIFSFGLNEILAFINRGRLFGAQYLPSQEYTPLIGQNPGTPNLWFLRTAERWIGIAAIVETMMYWTSFPTAVFPLCLWCYHYP